MLSIIVFNRFIILLFKCRWQIKRYCAMCTTTIIIYYLSVKRDNAIACHLYGSFLICSLEGEKNIRVSGMAWYLSYWHKEIKQQVIRHTHYFTNCLFICFVREKEWRCSERKKIASAQSPVYCIHLNRNNTLCILPSSSCYRMLACRRFRCRWRSII